MVSPGIQQRSRKVSIGELIQLSERKSCDSFGKDSETSDGIRETSLDGPVIHSGAQVVLTDPKLEKKVTFARLLNKVCMAYYAPLVWPSTIGNYELIVK